MPHTRLRDCASRVDRHLLSCAALIGANMVGSTLALPAHSAIIYSTFSYLPPDGIALALDFSVSMTTKYYTGPYLGMIDGTSYEFAVFNEYGDAYFIANTGYVGGELYFSGVILGPPLPYVYQIAAGTSIGSTTTWIPASPNGTAFPNLQLITYGGKYWVEFDSGYIGVKITKGGLSYYGWIGLSITAPVPSVEYATITGFAWESVAGVPIVAGAVPEPGSWALALLAGGAAGVSAWRRRRREEQAA